MNILSKAAYPVLALSFFTLGCSPEAPPTEESTSIAEVSDEASWSSLNQIPVVNDLAYSAGQFSGFASAGFYVGVGESGSIVITSANRSNTTVVNSGIRESLGKVVVNGSQIIAWPAETGGTVVSSGGETWTRHLSTGTGDCSGVPYSAFHDGSQFVALHPGGQLCTSSTGASWTKTAELIGTNPISAAYGNGYYVLGDQDGSIRTTNSLDSLSWTIATLPAGTNSIQKLDIIYADSKFIATSDSDILYSTDNGANWSKATVPASSVTFNKLSYSSGQGFVAFNNYTLADGWENIFSNAQDKHLASSDGLTWTDKTSAGEPLKAGVNGPDTMFVYDFSGNGYAYDAGLTSWVASPATTGPVDDIVGHTSASGGVIYASSVQSYLDTDAGVRLTSTLYKNTSGTWSTISSSTSEKYGDVFYTDSGLLLLANDYGLLATANDGSSWDARLNYDHADRLMASTKIGSTTYYVGSRGAVLSSTDGVSFTTYPRVTSASLIDVASDGTGLVAVTDVGTVVHFFDGGWAQLTVGTNSGLNAVTWNGTAYVVVGNMGKVFTSPDGAIWTERTYANPLMIRDVISNGSMLVALDLDVATSTDNGVTWTARAIAASSELKNLTFDGSNYYVFSDSAVFSSADAITWSVVNAAYTNPGTSFNDVIYDVADSKFVAYSPITSSLYTSTDAETWALSTATPSDAVLHFFTANAAIEASYALNGYDQIIKSTSHFTYGAGYSTDGSNWILKTDQAYLSDIPQVGGNYVRISSDKKTAQTSADAVTWTDVTPAGLGDGVNVSAMAYVNSQFVAAASDRTDITMIYTSTDATNWVKQSTIEYGSSNYEPNHIYFDGTHYLLLADNIYTSGLMILKSTDLVNFTLYNTGIKESVVDFDVRSSDYLFVGNSGKMATRNYY